MNTAVAALVALAVGIVIGLLVARWLGREREDTEQTLAARVLETEHRIYPQAARWLAHDRLRITGHGTVEVTGAPAAAQSLVSPPAER